MRFIEKLSPLACVPDEYGALKAVVFENGAEAGGTVTLPARSLFVAAGTQPNMTSERETPGAFEVDAKAKAFKAFRAVRGADGALSLEPPTATDPGFFTSYNRAGKLVSFYGDNHPTYAGSVVRAMASAKDGYPHVAALFRDELAGQRAEEQPRRDGAWRGVLRAPRQRAAAGDRAPGAADADDRRGRGERAGRGAQVRARSVLPPAELRIAVAAGRRAAPADGGAGAHRRVGRQGQGPAVDDRARDGRQLAPVRRPAAGRAGRGHGSDRHADGDPEAGVGVAVRRRPRQRRALLDRARRCASRAAASSTSRPTRRKRTSTRSRRSRPAPTR